MFRKSFPNFRQLDSMDCGPTCLKIIAKYYGKEVSLESLRRHSHIDREGVSLAGIKEAAETIGFETFSFFVSWKDLETKVNLPCIVHWEGNHFLTVYKIGRSKVYVSDPARGKYDLNFLEFKKKWNSEGEKGVVMTLEPTHDFLNKNVGKKGKYLLQIIRHFLNFEGLLSQLILGLLVSSIIQLALPFFTQSIVDYGIEYEDLGFIQILLICQVFLILIQGLIEIFRDWILLHISMRVNIRMMSDYLTKLILLPVSFFTRRGVGDLVKRINDNERIEEFLTNGSLTFLFDILNVFLFGLVLIFYSKVIFGVFFFGSLVYVLWSLSFMKKKALLDEDYFKASAKNQSKILELIYGIEDIKVNGSQERRKKEWYETQLKLFQVTSSNLRISHIQMNGAQILNELKNIVIVFVSAYSVIEGAFSLGVMLAIQFIIGQLNVPLNNMMSFLLDYQKAELSASRLYEVYQEKPEEFYKENDLKADHDSIIFRNVSFRYGPPGTPYALKNVSLSIPRGEVTAIVGHSGSGKSTLFKLLLNFYPPTEGNVYVGNYSLNDLSIKKWRQLCGVVLQEGRLFDDTIERNITESKSEQPTNLKELKKAIKYSMLEDFVENLPYKLRTKVGNNGIRLSGGEKQRILIARSIYKNPNYFFLDEPTSSLDSINETNILKNLESFYKNKTVVIIAHRLSTIRNADNIIVLDSGKLVEEGNHKSLIKNKSVYWELVQNQMDYFENI